MEHDENANGLHGSEVAIVAMTGRFPGARDLEAYWRNIREGVESISVFSDGDLEAAGIDPRRASGPEYVRARGIIEDVELFDAPFFGYSPRDAELMDPQQRLFLQMAWQVLELGGYDPKTYRGLIGVFGGASVSSYQTLLYSNPGALRPGDPESIGLGNVLTYLTTRVSFKLDLKGPSYPVQTACSTSLVAVHLACQALLNAECDIAIAGGVSIHVPQTSGYVYQEQGILSPDGRCRPFDASAQGTVFSNGIGLVLLKRLEDALTDGDSVLAVIKGSAINNDGSQKASFTAPGVGGQTEVVADAIAAAEVNPQSITYIECHGSGTALGDSIEVQALTKAFGDVEQRGYCAIGSVKANIGHLDAAAGVAGLIKAVLALQHKQLPPSPNFESPNRDIHFEHTPFFVNTALTDWSATEEPRRAGVSSHGFGGTNAHVILEEAPPVEVSGPSRSWQVLMLSAESQEGVDEATANLAAHLERAVDLDPADAAYTLQVGRRAFRHRRIVVCHDREHAVEVLKNKDPKLVFAGRQEAQQRPVVFLFPGQGAQYVGMGRELYETEQTFREVVDECADLVADVIGCDLRTVLYPRDGDTDVTANRLRQTAMAQPALFVTEYALARLWMEWGIQPAAMLGHSIGEYVAACLAGVLRLDDALRLVSLRGKLMGDMPAGVMLAVPLSEAEVRQRLTDGLWLSVINAPDLCVVSGEDGPVSELERRLTDEGLECRRLHTSHAFHSGLMDAAVEPFVEAVEGTEFGEPSIPYFSNLTGQWVDNGLVGNPTYWGRQLRETVRFAEAVAALVEDDRAFLEVGPGQTLGGLVRQQIMGRPGRAILSSLHTPRGHESDMASMLTALGRLWLAGVPIDWNGFYRRERRVRVPLPTYPFERQRYWVRPVKPDAQLARARRGRADQRSGLVEDWFYVPVWARVTYPASTNLPGDGAWLVFADSSGVGERLANRLEELGRTVVRVTPGARFAPVREGHYELNPRERRDYDALILATGQTGKPLEAIVHLWSLGATGTTNGDGEAYQRDQDHGFGSVLLLTQALGERDDPAPVRLGVVTDGIHDVTGEEQLSPGQAIVLGLCRVIPQEYPEVACKNIDLSAARLEEWTIGDGAKLDRLLHDLIVPSTEAVVAYRGGHRWLQTFQPLPLARPETMPARLRPGGVYLITGGLGEIGLHLAAYLAQAVRAKLVLLGRSGLPPESEWAQILAGRGGADPVTAHRIRKVKKLRSLGAEVLVLRADAGDREQMTQAFTAARERFGTTNGVIHAAGLVSGDAFQPIADTDGDVCRRQFEAKINGLCILDNLFRSADLDFCMLVSSLSALLGGLRYAAYASANAFMDTFALQRSRTSPFPWITVNWDNWLREEDAARLKQAGKPLTGLAMTPEEGVDAFRRIIGVDVGVQVVVSTGDLHARIDQWVKMGALGQGGAKPKGEEDATDRYPRPNLQTEFVAAANEVEQAIAEIWQDLLRVDRVGVNDNFFELGGDSFLGIQVISRLKRELGAKVSAVSLYEGPTVRLLANLIRVSDAPPPQAFDHSRARGEKRRERKLARQLPLTQS